MEIETNLGKLGGIPPHSSLHFPYDWDGPKDGSIQASSILTQKAANRAWLGLIRHKLWKKERVALFIAPRL